MDYTREIDRLKLKKEITCDELGWLLSLSEEQSEYLYKTAREVCDEHNGKTINITAEIDYTNYCRYNCLYCGVRAGHVGLTRYRMTNEKILNTVKNAYDMGIRSFILQGGVSPMDKDRDICELIKKLRTAYPDCSVTLSIGEKNQESYQAYYDAGAEGFLLYHMSANRDHYGQLHPPVLVFERRVKCLFELLDIGYNVGSGIIIGAPTQTVECLYDDLNFINELCPKSIDIVPFIPHDSTPFAFEECCDLNQALKMIAIIRIIHPKLVLPVTIPLATMDERGYEKGIHAGANAIVLNFTPMEIRKRFQLFDEKYGVEDDGKEVLEDIKNRVKNIGYETVFE